jgi:hypothetical protein
MLTYVDPNLRDLGGEDGAESEEGKKSKEGKDSQEEKEVTCFENLMRRIAAFAIRTGGSFLQNISATDNQAGPLCGCLLHKGPVFH